MPPPRQRRPARVVPEISATERMETRVVKRLRPSQPGAQKLARRYGDALVCVRYRHNVNGTHRYTTVELIVDDAPVESRARLDELVHVRLAFDDAAQRHRALAHGAQWDVERKLWSMSRRTAKRLRLARQIVKP